MSLRKIVIYLLIAFVAFCTAGCRDNAYDNIEKAPVSVQKIIAAGLTDNLELKNCYTVMSKNYSDSYYVAGEIYGGSMRGAVAAVWILDNYENPENVLSVNQSAIAFSSFKASKYDKPKASITNIKPARILKKYVERKYYNK